MRALGEYSEVDWESATASDEMDVSEVDWESATASDEMDVSEVDWESATASDEVDESDEHPTAAKSIAVRKKTRGTVRISPPIDVIGISVVHVSDHR